MTRKIKNLNVSEALNSKSKNNNKKKEGIISEHLTILNVFKSQGPYKVYSRFQNQIIFKTCTEKKRHQKMNNTKSISYEKEMKF